MRNILEYFEGLNGYHIFMYIVLSLTLFNSVRGEIKMFVNWITKKPLDDQKDELWRIDVTERINQVEGEIKEVRTGVSEISERLDESINQSIKHDDKLKYQLDDITSLFVDREINSIRSRILDFEARLLEGKPASKEKFDNIFDMYCQYEAILKKYNRKNGQVELAIEMIRNEYMKKWNDKNFAGCSETK